MAKTAPRSKKAAARKAAPRRHSTTLVPPAVGEYWKGQGGYYAGIDRLGQHLILHPDFCKKSRFGAYGVAIKGADDNFDGRKNTVALARVKEIELPLDAIAKLKVDGHQDFFIPARFQSALLYANLRDKFDLSDWYWTSTHFSDHYAWGQHFNYGTQLYLSKISEYFVRPVRSVIHSSLR